MTRLVDVVRAFVVKKTVYSAIPAELAQKHEVKAGTDLAWFDHDEGMLVKRSDTLEPRKGPTQHDTLKAAREGRVVLGDIVQGGDGPFELKRDDAVNEHGFITGSSGSGKTDTLKALIVRGWLAHGTPFLVFDRHGEYKRFMETIGAPILTPNQFNLWNATYGPEQQAMNLEEAMIYGLRLTLRQAYMIRQLILDLYHEKGFLKGRPDTWYRTPPSMKDLVDLLKTKLNAGYYKNEEDHISLQWVLAKLECLTRFTEENKDQHVNLISHVPACIVFSGRRADDERDFFVYAILQQLVEARTGKPHQEPLSVIIDEADHVHSIFREPLTDRMEDPIGVRIMRFGKKTGVSLLVASQDASDISEAALANIATTMVLATKDRYISRLLHLSRTFARMLERLRRGEALVSQIGKPGPMIVQVQPLSQAEIDAAREKTWGIRTILSSEEFPVVKSENE
jgi:hypothetical protein